AATSTAGSISYSMSIRTRASVPELTKESSATVLNDAEACFRRKRHDVNSPAAQALSVIPSICCHRANSRIPSIQIERLVGHQAKRRKTGRDRRYDRLYSLSISDQ